MTNTKELKGKLRFSLIPINFIVELMKVLEGGAVEHGDTNWQNGPRQLYVDALLRHCIELCKGNTHDYKSGLHHAGHIAANAAFIQWFDDQQNSTEISIEDLTPRIAALLESKDAKAISRFCRGAILNAIEQEESANQQGELDDTDIHF